MWAVGETDLEALTITGNVTNVAFGIGSFLLGFAVNIWIGYGGATSLTEIGSFLYYKCSFLALITAVAFYGIGVYFHYKKGSLWDKIKSESRQITPQ